MKNLGDLHYCLGIEVCKLVYGKALSIPLECGTLLFGVVYTDDGLIRLEVRTYADWARDKKMIGGLLQGMRSILDQVQFLGAARSNLLLPYPPQNLSIGLPPKQHVKQSGFEGYLMVSRSLSMPKELGRRSLSSHRSQGSHYKPYSRSRGGSQGSSSKEGEEVQSKKEWEDATCPICMEHPHNAVLLMCSSYEKGCRPYMCDTSYRHSNCLDQYKKAHTFEKSQSQEADSPFAESLSAAASSSVTRSQADVRHGRVFQGDRVESILGIGTVGTDHSGSLREDMVEHRSGRGSGLFSDPLSGRGEDRVNVNTHGYAQGVALSIPGVGVQDTENLSLVCPLCRGKVKGWKVVERARLYLNCKIRNCAHEICPFSGTYKELRRHARVVHPLARPADVDLGRQRNWRRLERQRDIGDVLSSIRSAMPGATVFGDYVIDEEDPENDVDDSDFPGDEGNWWTVFLLFQVFGPAASAAGGRSFSARMRRFPRRHHLSDHSRVVRPSLWGENLQVSRTNESNRDLANNANTEGSTASTTRRRRTRQ